MYIYLTTLGLYLEGPLNQVRQISFLGTSRSSRDEREQQPWLFWWLRGCNQESDISQCTWGGGLQAWHQCWGGGVGSQGIKEGKVLQDDTLLHELFRTHAHILQCLDKTLLSNVDVANIAAAESDIAASSSGCYRCFFCGESFDNTDTLNEHVMKSCDNVN